MWQQLFPGKLSKVIGLLCPYSRSLLTLVAVSSPGGVPRGRARHVYALAGRSYMEHICDIGHIRGITEKSQSALAGRSCACVSLSVCVRARVRVYHY